MIFLHIANCNTVKNMIKYIQKGGQTNVLKIKKPQKDFARNGRIGREEIVRHKNFATNDKEDWIRKHGGDTQKDRCGRRGEYTPRSATENGEIHPAIVLRQHHPHFQYA
jgi:hypothetical protein